MTRRFQVELLERRDCPAAGSTLIPIVSNATYTLSINTYGRVAEMQVSQAEFNIFANNNGNTTVANEALITKRLYAVLPDVFDFITVVPNVANTTSNLLGYNRTVRSVATGLGQGSIDNGAAYGSPAQLSSFLYMADLIQLYGGTGDHEIMHQWANFLPKSPTRPCITPALSLLQTRWKSRALTCVWIWSKRCLARSSRFMVSLRSMG